MPMMIAVFVMAFAAFAADAGERGERWFTSRTFLACEESLFISCAAATATVRLRADFTVDTRREELSGRWRLEDADHLTIGEREFVFSARDQLFISPDDESLLFGIVLAEDSKAGRKALKARERRFDSPDWQREVAHLYLRKRLYVHDTCLTLIDVGDRTSIDSLVAVLPERPRDRNGPSAGVECTFGHCADALSRITGKRCGVYRQDWEQCLKPSAADGPPPASQR